MAAVHPWPLLPTLPAPQRGCPVHAVQRSAHKVSGAGHREEAAKQRRALVHDDHWWCWVARRTLAPQQQQQHQHRHRQRRRHRQQRSYLLQHGCVPHIDATSVWRPEIFACAQLEEASDSASPSRGAPGALALVASRCKSSCGSSLSCIPWRRWQCVQAAHSPANPGRAALPRDDETPDSPALSLAIDERDRGPSTPAGALAARPARDAHATDRTFAAPACSLHGTAPHRRGRGWIGAGTWLNPCELEVRRTDGRGGTRNSATVQAAQQPY